MYLRQLHIKNFRKVEDLSIDFPRGLCVIVGENNTGKTTIIDALRFLLFPSREFDALRVSEDDFRNGTDYAPIEISCTFTDLTDEDEVHFQECLVDIDAGKFEVQINSRIEFNKTTRRCNFKMWGGETEGGALPSNHYDRFATIYLQPLRDPERGLRPGQHSQVSRLVDCLADETQHVDFEKIAREANDKIRALEPVETARQDINSQMEAIAGQELAQKTQLIFADPAFRRIIAGLQPEIEELPFSLNGLGYNNLIFTSATLGTLRRSAQYSHRAILIEEPEAHLHPQLQVLLLKHLAKVTSEESENEVQVIASTHSPILASQAPIDSIVSIHEAESTVKSISVSTIEMDGDQKKAKILKKKLQRYLDTTRGELFFARRILMVEGIAEALLLPVFAKMAGGSLKESAVSVVNVDGLNFNAFLPLFGENRLQVPVAILSDGDADVTGGEPSPAAKGFKEKENEISNLCVALSDITFEHELARSAKLLPVMIEVLRIFRPQKAKQVESNIVKMKTDDEKADEFYRVFKETNVSKGCFAQDLAILLDEKKISQDAIPEYIMKVLRHLDVIKARI